VKNHADELRRLVDKAIDRYHARPLLVVLTHFARELPKLFGEAHRQRVGDELSGIVSRWAMGSPANGSPDDDFAFSGAAWAKEHGRPRFLDAVARLPVDDVTMDRVREFLDSAKAEPLAEDRSAHDSPAGRALVATALRWTGHYEPADLTPEERERHRIQLAAMRAALLISRLEKFKLELDRGAPVTAEHHRIADQVQRMWRAQYGSRTDEASEVNVLLRAVERASATHRSVMAMNHELMDEGYPDLVERLDPDLALKSIAAFCDDSPGGGNGRVSKYDVFAELARAAGLQPPSRSTIKRHRPRPPRPNPRRGTKR